MKIDMNTTVLVLLVLLVTLVQTILAYPAQNDDWEYTADNCPPGIWVCRKKRVEIPKPQVSNDCPPGIWTCQRKRDLKGAKEMPARNAVQGVDARRQQILKRLMKEKARETAKMLNAARRHEPQMKRAHNCPPGIWAVVDIYKQLLDEAGYDTKNYEGRGVCNPLKPDNLKDNAQINMSGFFSV